jgi:deoxyguanosine kinase
MSHKYIAIEGVIGVGKTTLARLLQTHFEAKILLEVFEENPFLADFYQDRGRYAFQTQIFFLLSRYHQQHKAVPRALRKATLISDYTFAKDELFAWLNLKDDELAMYGRVHAALSEKIPKPDLIVYLRAEHETIMRRIAQRDRPYERDMDPGYIRELATSYDAWLHNMQEIPVLTVDVTALDFLGSEQDLALVARAIGEALAKQGEQTKTADSQLTLLQQGNLRGYQQFHSQLDRIKGFDPDLFINYVLLTEELGEVATVLTRVWGEERKLALNGRSAEEARQQALDTHREGLRDELADLLAYTLKLANYADIDLEQAYLDKMRRNVGREWPGQLFK